VIDGIRLLAETEGIFTEPAGGVTISATRQLIERGLLGRDESIVVCITGNGYKTADVLKDRVGQPVHIGRSLADFEASEAAPATAGSA
jgi:threonine synthase